MKRTLIALGLLSFAPLAIGCQSRMGTCAGGQCGLSGGGCAGGACQVVGGGTNVQGANANYVPNGGQGGVLGGIVGRHSRGPQSHMGPQPGPAMGEPAPTVGYPYYTTRGPRDFLSSNPPSIGR